MGSGVGLTGDRDGGIMDRSIDDGQTRSATAKYLIQTSLSRNFPLVLISIFCDWIGEGLTTNGEVIW